MSHVKLIVGFVVVLTCGMMYGQDEPGPNYRHLKPMEWIIGQWVCDLELPGDFPGVGKQGELVKSSGQV